MKINKRLLTKIFIISLFLNISCQKFTKITTDDYSIKIPDTEIYNKSIFKDSIEVGSSKNIDKFSVSVIRKNKYEFLSENECIASELEYFIHDKDSKNISTKKAKINGTDAIIFNGINYENNTKTYWTFAIFTKEYYYYILRIFSTETKLNLNKYYNSKIINSFHIK